MRIKKQDKNMIHVSAPTSEAPAAFGTDLQRMTYDMLDKLGIKFERVDNEPAISMDDCEAIDEALHMKTVKTLFLTNRQQTKFYLCVMPGDKAFSTKDFGRALGVSRVSFAPASLLEDKMGTIVGATTIFSMMLPTSADVRLIIDKAVADSQWYGCTDGTTTGYMKISTSDVMHKFLPAIGLTPEIVVL